MQPNERALLTMLVARLRQIDADVFVGHNFAAFDLDVLLHRLQHHKVRLALLGAAAVGLLVRVQGPCRLRFVLSWFVCSRARLHCQ